MASVPTSEIPPRPVPATHPLVFLPALFFTGFAAVLVTRLSMERLEQILGTTSAARLLIAAVGLACLSFGSLAYARFLSNRWLRQNHLILLQVAAAITTVVALALFPIAQPLYSGVSQLVGTGVFSGALCAALLIGPSLLVMGAMLPALGAMSLRPAEGLRAGATVGTGISAALAGATLATLAGTLRLHPALAAPALLLIAAAIHLIGAAFTWFSGATKPLQSATTLPSNPTRQREAMAQWIALLVAAMLLGASVAAGYSAWSRHLAVILGDTFQLRAIVAAVFLLGLAAGAMTGTMLSSSAASARLIAGGLILLTAPALAWTLYTMHQGIPNWPLNNALATDIAFVLQTVWMQCCWAILPPTLLWGMAFPLLLAGTSDLRSHAARTIGAVAAVTAIGAILGMYMLGRPFSTLGVESTHHWLFLICGLAGIALVLPEALVRARRHAPLADITAALISVLAAILVPSITEYMVRRSSFNNAPWRLMSLGRGYLAASDQKALRRIDDLFPPLFQRQGQESAVILTRPGPFTFLDIDGRRVASSTQEDLRRQLMLGHLPSLFHPDAGRKKVLVLGAGSGIAAGAFTLHPLEKLVICEPEPVLIEALSSPLAKPRNAPLSFSSDPPFSREDNGNNNGILDRTQEGHWVEKRLQVVTDDPRHFLLTTRDTFDIITHEMPPSWSAAAGTRTTVEFFQLAQSRLNPHGLLVQRVPLYENDEATAKIQIRTFFDSVPHATIWGSNASDTGYGLVLIGGNDPLTIDGEQLRTRLSNLLVTRALQPAQLSTVTDVLKTYAGRAEDLKPWLAEAPVHRDAHLVGAYSAGKLIQQSVGWTVYGNLVQFRKFPADLFNVDAETRRAIEAAW